MFVTRLAPQSYLVKALVNGGKAEPVLVSEEGGLVLEVALDPLAVCGDRCCAGAVIVMVVRLFSQIVYAYLVVSFLDKAVGMHPEVIVGGVERDKRYGTCRIAVELGSAVAAVQVIFDIGVQRSVEADLILVQGAGSKGKPVLVRTVVLNAAVRAWSIDGERARVDTGIRVGISTGWVLSKSTLSR